MPQSAAHAIHALTSDLLAFSVRFAFQNRLHIPWLPCLKPLYVRCHDYYRLLIDNENRHGRCPA